MDYILNGAGHGSVAERLLQSNGDLGVLRPFIGNDGRSYVTMNNGGKQKVVLTNANATLRKEEWIHLDTAILKAAQPEMRAFNDLRAAGLTYSVPNAMGKMTLESQNQSDITPATTSLDGLRKGQNDRPEYGLVGVPLPIHHKDFGFSFREIMTSRNSNTPLDTTMAELSARKVGEQVEKMTVGVPDEVFAFAGYSLYGYANTPLSMTKTLTHPLAGGWTPQVLIDELLSMKQQSRDAYYRGPWRLYNSPMWDKYLDNDYSQAKSGDKTLRQRVLDIKGIDSIDTLDFLTGNKIIMVQKTSDVCRAIIGQDMTTLQWESEGGMWFNWKILCILAVQIRADHYGRTGLVVGSATDPS